MRKIALVVVFAAFALFFQNAYPGPLQLLYGVVVGTLAPLDRTPVRKPKNADGSKPGFPHVNFFESSPGIANATEMNGSAPVAGTAADFDSDGIADLITTDSTGSITLFKGNPATKYPYSASAKQQYAETGAEPMAFSEAKAVASVSFSPDFLASGDFNVDGKSDVLAASKNARSLELLAGNGQAGFGAPQLIELSGNLIAIEAGEIGREDDQQDLAAVVMTKSGPQLQIFEWLHGAFAQKPEVHKLSFVPDSIAIGDLDGDFYHDVVLTGGRNLMIVHGRGQAYPYDRMGDLDIRRPEAVVETRTMPFEIAGISIGLFTEKRGRSIAMLTKNGSVEILETVKRPPSQAELNRAEAVRMISKRSPFVPVGVHPSEKAALEMKMPTTAEDADARGMLMADSSLSRKEIEEKLREASMQRDKEFLKLSPEMQAAKKAEAKQRGDARRESASRKFESSISAKLQQPLARWSLKSIISDAKLEGAAAAGTTLLSIRVSDSGRDDLILQNRTTGRVEIVTQNRTEIDKIRNTEVVSLESNSAISAFVPMRLNGDALDDLVELRADSPSPSVLMTAPANIFVVTTDDDAAQIGPCDGAHPCNLRHAIALANATPGTDEINFNIPGGGLHTIHPQTPLPTITNAVSIDGFTQPGSFFQMNIEIKGDLLSGAAEGLRVNTSNSVISGLVINEMPSILHDGNSQEAGSGIVILSTSNFPNTSNNKIVGNYLGIDPTGLIAKGNHANGISVYDSDNNQIGEGGILGNNILSGNGKDDEFKQGVGLAVTGSNGNHIHNNLIGVGSSGVNKIANSYGVFLGGANNDFGGEGFVQGNTVAGNGVDNPSQFRCDGVGIDEGIIIDPSTGELLTSLNRYKGNDIGLSGNTPIGNCSRGIQFSNITMPVLGSLTQPGRNVISNNGYDAVWAGGGGEPYLPGMMTIIGNNIGTDRSGTVSMPNDERNGCAGFCVQTGTVWLIVSDGAFVSVGEPGLTTPGGSCTGGCNLISGQSSGNTNSLGEIDRNGYGQVFIQNNYVGTDITGTSALRNDTNGILAFFSDTNIGVPIGDGAGGWTSTRNVVSGNGASGILLSTGGLFQNEGYEGKFRVEGNFIGTSADGNSAVPNSTQPDNDIFGQAIGAFINSTGYAAIGNTLDISRNIISGNKASGVALNGTGIQLVLNNWIGLSASAGALGNRLHGVTLSNIYGTVGGTGPDRRNVIWNNGRSGIMVFSSGGLPTFANNIGDNSFRDNGALGIDLTNTYTAQSGATDGVTANDCYDFDTGANDLQNYPDLQAPIVNPDNTTKLNGALRSFPSSTYTIRFYANSFPAFGTPYGQGEYAAGTKSVTTDGNGFASFSFNTAEVWPAGYQFTATATDSWGSTSEFSCAAGLCTPTVNPCEAPIVVNVTTDDNDANTADAACDTDVSNTGLQCSLRAAIQEANARPGTNIINFDIPGGGVQTIAPLTALPAIIQRVLMNGESQPGYTSTPLIEVRGDLGTAVNGFLINAHSDIRGLAINRFSGIGIKIERTVGATAPGSYIAKNFIGTTPDGQAAASGQQMQYGVSITGNTQNSLVGNTSITGFGKQGNLIANCSIAAIQLSGSGVQQNKVIGNRIGMTAAGSDPIVNGTYGILLTSNSHHNTIGDTIENGNLISGTSDTGIRLEGSTNNNTIVGNLIGTDQDGNLSTILGQNGIVIIGGASSNKIGTDQEHRNVISGNARSLFSFGIRVEPTAGSGNVFSGNYIGLNKAGNARVPNTDGVLILKDGFTFGGGSSYNVVSGNVEHGIKIESSSGFILSGSIKKNYIGTDGSGQADLNLGNNIGVAVQGQVSGISVSENVISGNLFGVRVMQGAEATIQKNIIGLNATGEGVIPNFYGVWVNETVASTVKENAVAGNVIGILLGDDTGGLGVEALPFKAPPKFVKKNTEGVPVLTENVKVQNNYVGINKTGILVFRNRFAGIAVGENARNNLVGGKRSGEGNTISGGEYVNNFGVGVWLGTGNDEVDPNRIPRGNVIQGNRIGIRRTQYIAAPNNYGIWVQNATDNLIGAVDCDYGNGGADNTVRKFGDEPPPDCNVKDYSNIIGGNVRDGIFLTGSGASSNRIISNFVGIAPDGTKIGNLLTGIKVEGPNNTIIDKNTIAANGEGILLSGGNTFQNRMRANYIGTNEALVTNAGNTLSGVRITNDAHDNVVGGPEPDSGNTIAHNGGPGVWIDSSAGVGNLVDPNKIFLNVGVGIDLGYPGRTNNDPGDGDEGPNRGQNYPEITEQIIDGNGDLIVRFYVDSDPENSNYGPLGIYIEFFRADPFGEGELFLGFTHYTVADHQGGSPGDKAVNLGNAANLGFPPGSRVTATATDASNNTSEFTPVQFEPTAAGVSVSGRVLDARGRGISRATVTITNMDGVSRSVQTSNFGFYTIEGVEAGASYVLSVRHKRYRFSVASIVISLKEDLTDLNFAASGQ